MLCNKATHSNYPTDSKNPILQTLPNIKESLTSSIDQRSVNDMQELCTIAMEGEIEPLFCNKFQCFSICDHTGVRMSFLIK